MTRILAAIPLLGGLALVAQGQGGRMAVLWLLGAALGAALLLAAFSFAGAFRTWLAEGRGAGLRAQFLLLGLGAALMLPALALDGGLRGFVFPIGWALVLGAFLFGVGMQLGGGCGSGTLFAAGGGQGARMWVTLGAFVAGATLASWEDRWLAWPALAPVSLPAALGTGPALALTLAALALLWRGSLALERRRHGVAEPLGRRWAGGSAALAVLALLTLLAAGRPWAITAAFPLWGAKLVEAAGWDDPAFWPFWEDPTRTEALLRPLLADRTTVMDLGLMAGAFAAAALAARLSPWRWPRPGEWLASLLGGVLLGVGAVLASGCNISAWFGGVATGSLHGWAWIGPAILGNWLGMRLRPWFRL